MPSNLTYSYLVWEDISSLPLPDSIKAITKDIEWDKFEWFSVGFPMPWAVYTLTGKDLYLAQLPNGDAKIEKQEFTGDVHFVNYFVDKDPEGTNYFIGLKATFFKGELKDVVVDKLTPQSTKEYTAQLEVAQAKIQQKTRKYTSWWYKWLYKPWFFAVRGPSLGLVWLLMVLRWIVIKIAYFLTPL